MKHVNSFKKYDPPLSIDGGIAEYALVDEEHSTDVDGNHVILSRTERPIVGVTKSQLIDKLNAHKLALKEEYDGKIAEVQAQIDQLGSL